MSKIIAIAVVLGFGVSPMATLLAQDLYFPPTDGEDWATVDPADAGAVLADRVIELMQATGMPNGLRGVGYTDADIGDLVEGSLPQRRILDNAPIDVGRELLAELYAGALSYW